MDVAYCHPFDLDKKSPQFTDEQLQKWLKYDGRNLVLFLGLQKYLL